MLGNKNLAFAKSQQPERPAVTYLWHVKVSEGAARRAACPTVARCRGYCAVSEQEEWPASSQSANNNKTQPLCLERHLRVITATDDWPARH